MARLRRSTIGPRPQRPYAFSSAAARHSVAFRPACASFEGPRPPALAPHRRHPNVPIAAVAIAAVVAGAGAPPRRTRARAGASRNGDRDACMTAYRHKPDHTQNEHMHKNQCLYQNQRLSIKPVSPSKTFEAVEMCRTLENLPPRGQAHGRGPRVAVVHPHRAPWSSPRPRPAHITS